MRDIFWIFGKSGVGKSTYVSMRREFYSKHIDGVDVVETGKRCRELFGESMMAQTSQPNAPNETESYVRKIISDSISKRNRGVNIIDGCPRKPSQVRWILESMSGGGINTHFVFLTCDDVVRRERLFNRDIVGSPARQLTEARLNGEDRDVLRTIEEILINKDRFPNVDFDIIDTNEHMSFKKVNAQHVNVDCIDTNEVEGIVPDFTDLKTMMRLNDALSNMTLGCMGLSTTDLFKETCEIDEAPIWNRGVEWSRRFALRAIDELKELLDEFPDEWWRKDKVDVRAARVELIDALHFIFSAANAMGMTPEMVCKTYYQKRAVNVKRQASGYTKRLKIPGDDLMIGSVLNPWTGADIGQPIPVRVDETDVAGQDIRSTKTEGSVQ